MHASGFSTPATPARSEGAELAAWRRYGLAARDHHMLEVLGVLGLAGVYLVNAAVAVLQPADFQALVSKSLLTQTFGLHSVGPVSLLIAVNDVVLGVLLLVSLFTPAWRRPLLAWSGLWLLGVAVIKLLALDAITG